jgi:hypothetical protein
MVTCRIRVRSTTTPPSRRARPAQSWPPPRTDRGKSWARAMRTAACTSAADSHSTTMAGRTCTAPFHTTTATSSSRPAVNTRAESKWRVRSPAAAAIRVVVAVVVSDISYPFQFGGALRNMCGDVGAGSAERCQSHALGGLSVGRSVHDCGQVEVSGGVGVVKRRVTHWEAIDFMLRRSQDELCNPVLAGHRDSIISSWPPGQAVGC